MTGEGSDDFVSLRDVLRQTLQAVRPATNGPTRVPRHGGSEGEAARALLRERALVAHRKDQDDVMEQHLLSCGVQRQEVAHLVQGLRPEWEACRVAREWWPSPSSILLLLGATGTGKTLAAAELIAQCRFGYVHPDFGETWAWPSTLSERGLFVLAGDLATTSYYGVDAEKQRSRLLGCRLLVIDELGTEVASAPWQSLLDTIVNQRMRAQRKTVLLSNLDKAGFKARYDDRITRRVRDEGQVVSLGSVTLTRTPRDGRADAAGGGA